MGSNVLLIPHQETYLQSYKNFPEKRWHMLVTGFGGGKTRANTILCLQLISELQGKKDRAGDGARIIVAGYTLAHLEKTFMLYFRSYMNQSKTKWREDTKNHIAYCGTVTVIFLPMEQPDLLFGEDAVACIQEESDELPESTLIEACKALSERTRQQIPGYRSPFLCIASTSQGQKGLYRLYNNFIKSGIGFVLVHGRTQDNFYLPRAQVIDLYKMYDETERKVFLDGEFLSVSKGRVFPGFDWARNFSNDDLDLNLPASAKVFIGQDYNCITGSTPVYTLRGSVPMRDVTTKDYVLTRKGFKRVLTKVNRGVKIVHDFNRVGATDDHIAITPKGEMEICRAENYYYLKEQSTGKFINLSEMAEELKGLRLSLMTELSGQDTLMTGTGLEDTILQDRGCSCTDIFTRSLTAALKRVCRSTTGTDMMITDLKLLKKYLLKTTRNCITDLMVQISEGSCGRYPLKKSGSGTALKKAEKHIAEALRKTGVRESSLVKLFAGIAAVSLRLGYALHRGALNAVVKGGRSRKQKAIKEVREKTLLTARYLWSHAVCAVERKLQELQLHGIAKSIKVTGSVRGINERRENVYDIEVEDAHEFFAGGVLVHNCGFSRASAWVSLRDKDGVYRMHCIGGSTPITTLRGNVSMKDVTTDDYVLTRKGYKKVLTKVAQGIKMVYDFGGLQCTLDHVAITPQGDIPVCRAKQFYYLKGQNTSDIVKARNGVARFQLWKKYVGSMLYGKDTLIQNDLSTEIISSTQRMVERYSYTWRYITDLWVKYLMDGTSTIRKGSMITDLKALTVKVLDNTHYCTPRSRNVKCYQKQCGETGRTESLIGQLLVLFVAKILQLVPVTKMLLTVRYAEKKGKKKDLEHIIYYTVNVLLTELVNGVEAHFKELLCSISAPTVDISESPAGRPIGMQQVYDIEVEGQHEFFASGVLVHNCCKRYDFADIADAPSTFRYDYPTQDIYWVPDVTIKDSYPHFARELRKFQIHIIHRSKNPIVEDSCFLVSKMCYLGLIIFHSMAKEAAEAVSVASRDKNNQIPKGKAPTDWQHDADSVRYATNYMALVLPEYRDIRQTLISHIASLRKEVEENGEEQPVRKLAAGYVQIEGDAYLNRT